jgi:hypothetical protein
MRWFPFHARQVVTGWEWVARQPGEELAFWSKRPIKKKPILFGRDSYRLKKRTLLKKVRHMIKDVQVSNFRNGSLLKKYQTLALGHLKRHQAFLRLWLLNITSRPM